ncbi:hypothetical protein THRCLA_23001 [Thraustotheca clavata]|uniref:Uncharacterized protein n=1 Tax=Thraustotheca clavata TaxID=74557 RepID=A0A1V9YJF7_9STRA|nr:hypothetical protein THRCLA_23001 [Thraustotheca clavata]
MNRYCVGLKCGVWNVVDSLAIELDGKTILTEADYKMYWNNLRAMAEWSSTDVQKMGADAYLSPDDWVSMGFSSTASSSGDGFSNNNANMIASPGLVPEGIQVAENTGFISRVYNNPQPVSAISSGGAETGLNSYNWITTRSATATTIAQQNGKGAFVTTGATGAVAAAVAGQIAGTWYYMLKIRLVDLHPIFKQIDLMANPQLKLRIRFNTGYSDIAWTGATPPTMSLTSTMMNSGTTCPIMVASAVANNAMNTVLPATGTGSLRVAFGVLQNSQTTLATAGNYFPFTTCRLMLPFYDIANPTSIVSNPIKKAVFQDVYAQYFKQHAGIGATATQQNATFNLQLSGSWKTIKYMALIPYSETSSGHYASASNVEQFQSPFDSAPRTCQAGSSIRNFQVQIGNDNVFSKTVDYDHEMFHGEFTKINALNGGLTHELSNGLVEFQKFSTVNRIMVADCSRISNRDVPQSVVVSGVNGSCQGANLLVLGIQCASYKVCSSN